MAALKASELKYGQPVRVAVGDLWFTATQVEFPSAGEYEVGTLELNLAKLGLTDETVAGTANVAHEVGAGEVATTSAPPAVIWCDPIAANAKTQNESAKEVSSGFLAQVTTVSGKAILRLFGLTAAGDGKPVNEAKNATKVVPGSVVVTVYAFGK